MVVSRRQTTIVQVIFYMLYESRCNVMASCSGGAVMVVGNDYDSSLQDR
jgi:hypothetical protein